MSGEVDEAEPQKIATLREILETLRNTYCGKIGCEYMNIQIPEQKRWLQLRMEPTGNRWPLDAGHSHARAAATSIEAEEFEHFLHTRFMGHKRFSLEGAESAMVILDEILERAANANVHEAVIGMAHRGRLNMLANIVGKSLVQILLRVRRHRSGQHAGLGRREVSPGRERRPQIVGRPRDRGVGGVQSQSPGSGGSGGGRHRAAEAGPFGRRQARARDSRF